MYYFAITEKLKELGIESYQPGNNGKSGNEWGAVNSKEGCTGFGQVTVFNTAVGENKIGTTLLV